MRQNTELKIPESTKTRIPKTRTTKYRKTVNILNVWGDIFEYYVLEVLMNISWLKIRKTNILLIFCLFLYHIVKNVSKKNNFPKL
jgi:hypothetical protein